MKILLIILMVAVMASACKKGKDEPAPSAVNFQLASATFNGAAMDPTPNYQLTLHFDAAGNPTQYEASGTAQVLPTPGSSGDWKQEGDKLVFSNADNERTVSILSGQVSPLSSRLEVAWSMQKTEIPWPQVGDYTYTFERSQ